MELNRRVIYLFVALALSFPLIMRYTVDPAEMKSANNFYNLVDSLDSDVSKVAFVAFDFGPNTKAENSPQAEVVIEHLMRKRVPIILFSQYVLADPFLKSIPERIKETLESEFPGESWEYGKDWVNLGFRPGAGLLIQSLPKSDNFVEVFQVDANGTPLPELELFKHKIGLSNVALLAQFTGLVGTFDTYVQFFQSESYRPAFGHGCTSITIPEAYIYLDSGQLSGLLEGIAGAAWYSHRLSKQFPDRPKDNALVINTGLGIAHMLLILLIVLGNLTAYYQYRQKGRVS